MAQVPYTSYSFKAPPLMDEEFFLHLKSLPIKVGRIRYKPYEGFVKTFPGWCIFFGILVLWATWLHFFGEGESRQMAFYFPFSIWFTIATLSGALFSMFSWIGYHMDCIAYFDVYSRHINEAKDYAELRNLRDGLHPRPTSLLDGLFPDLNQWNRR
jgi:hypothetical protein